MKAIAVHTFRSAPQIIETPIPEMRDGEVLVRLSAAGINPFDWKVADGALDGKIPHSFPLILGFDGAGVVEKIGSDVKRFKVGDKVFMQAFQVPLGRGTYAEYIAVAETAPIAATPKTLGTVEAAALPTAGMTALDLLDKSGLKAMQTLLLVGATGGVGQFLVQLAKRGSVRVIATGTERDAALLKELGAESVVDYTAGPVADQVLTMHPRGVDGLIDLASDAKGFSSCATAVTSNGVALTTNYMADEKTLRSRGIRGGNFMLGASSALLERLAAQTAGTGLKITIERRVPFDEAIETVAAMRTGHARGKSIILIAP
jgi:NADPH:quinone reductase-like Zn-dependent oxidoreductase